MSDEYNFDSEKFDHDKMGFLNFKDLEGVCERHIENKNTPYNEEEVLKIVRWMEETKLNASLLALVLEGKIDIVFDEELMKENEDKLLFSMTDKAKKEAIDMGLFSEEDNSIVPEKFFDLNFEDKDEDA